jgi:hypothetical protein
VVGCNREVPGQFSLERIARGYTAQVDNNFSLPCRPHAGPYSEPTKPAKRTKHRNYSGQTNGNAPDWLSDSFGSSFQKTGEFERTSVQCSPSAEIIRGRLAKSQTESAVGPDFATLHACHRTGDSFFELRSR